jgi:hypothetical protein
MANVGGPEGKKRVNGLVAAAVDRLGRNGCIDRWKKLAHARIRSQIALHEPFRHDITRLPCRHP